MIVLRLGITSAFFRFYFDSEDAARRTLVVRTSFWFTMGMATLGLVARLGVRRPRSRAGSNLGDPWLVRAGFVGLWAQMNYAQMAALFRVEERPVGFAIASVANVLITIGATIALVVGCAQGRDRRRDRQLPRDAHGLRRRCSPTAATSSASSSTAACCGR